MQSLAPVSPAAICRDVIGRWPSGSANCVSINDTLSTPFGVGSLLHRKSKGCQNRPACITKRIQARIKYRTCCQVKYFSRSKVQRGLAFIREGKPSWRRTARRDILASECYRLDACVLDIPTKSNLRTDISMRAEPTVPHFTSRSPFSIDTTSNSSISPTAIPCN